MTATITVQPEAEADLAEAFAWYERRQQGLGRGFLYAIDRVFERIVEHPLLAPQVWREARRTAPRRFPYAVLYVERVKRSICWPSCISGAIRTSPGTASVLSGPESAAWSNRFGEA